EWATSCPPPRHNFDSIPRIRSERPAFDLHHPDAAVTSVAPAPDAMSKLMGPGDRGTQTLGGKHHSTDDPHGS
ncbi:MAG: cytochrome ubiquinol oxidase subunit I, partial [Allobranchiibius sp.]